MKSLTSMNNYHDFIFNLQSKSINKIFIKIKKKRKNLVLYKLRDGYKLISMKTKLLKFVIISLLLLESALGSKVNTNASAKKIGIASSMKASSSQIISQFNAQSSAITAVPVAVINVEADPSKPNCFYQDLASLIERTKAAIATFANLCYLNDRPELQSLVEGAKLVGQIEGYRDQDPSLIPVELLASVAAYTKNNKQFKFTTLLSALLDAVRNKGDVDNLVVALWQKMQDDLDAYVRSQFLPEFFRTNALNLLKGYRLLFALQTIKGDKDGCIPPTWKDVMEVVTVVDIDIVNKKVYNVPVNPRLPNDITVTPAILNEGNLAITFWGYENLADLKGETTVVFEGYSDNNVVYRYVLVPGEDHVLHQLFIGDKVYEMKSQANCSNYFFVVLSCTKQCDKYEIKFTVKILASNQRLSDSAVVFKDALEGVVIRFNKMLTFNNNIFRNFDYKAESELDLQILTMGQQLSEELLKKAVCPSGCKYGDEKLCVTCVEPKVQYQGQCVELCPDGTVMINGICNTCDDSCGLCSGTVNHCTECKKPNHLYEGQCVSTCPLGMTPDSNNNCVPCTPNCVDCIAVGTCDKCLYPKYVNAKGECVSECPDNFYGDKIGGSCNPCPDECGKCNNVKDCTTCNDGFYLLDKECVPNCGPGFYVDKSSKTCRPCEKNCEVCLDSVTCTDCSLGFDLNKGDCNPKCENGQQMINGVCAPCEDSKCKTCSGLDLGTCNECAINMFIKEGKCVDRCGEGYYTDDNRNCKPCVDGCSVCNPDKCIKCEGDNYVFDGTKCVHVCPVGTIPSGNQCVPCTGECGSCLANSLETCTDCPYGLVLLEGKCVKECPSGYHLDKNDVCQKCIEGCGLCGNTDNCVTCETPYYYKNGFCVKDCEEGYYLDKNNVCEPCVVDNCNVCTKQTCLQCEPPKKLFNGVCLEECPLGTFQMEDGSCKSCSSECIDCNGVYTCNVCTPPNVLQGKVCQESCDPKYKNVDGVCVPCTNTNCLSCESNLSTCTECPAGKTMNNGECVTVCPGGTYKMNNECKPCVEPCLTCQSDKKCDSCIKSFNYNPTTKTCTDGCPDGSAMVNGTCNPCVDKECLKCDGTVPSTCIVCKPNKKLLNGDCVETCPNGNFPMEGKCEPCVTNCGVCGDNKDCTQCKEGYVKKEGKCVEKCGDGWVDTDGTCNQCFPTCKTCVERNTSRCTECNPPLFLYMEQCISSCPEGTHKVNGTCKECKVEACKDCQGGNTCTGCLPGYVLQEGECVVECEPGYVLDISKKKCNKCVTDNCHKCDGTLLSECEKCEPGYYKLNNKCVKECGLGQIKNTATQECEPCPPGCNVCNGKTNCNECEIGYFLYNGVCTKKCPAGYMEGDKRCNPCTVNSCGKCECEETCQECLPPKKLIDNKCVEVCPDGTYNKEGKCQPCTLFCNKCKSAQTCDECAAGKVISTDGTCIDQCASGTVDLNGKCYTCQSDPKCNKCDANALQNCLQCKDGEVLKLNQCVPECGTGYYDNNGKCTSCTNKCDKCNGDVCIDCEKGYVLHQGKCVALCPLGYMVGDARCEPCTGGCEKCDPTKCDKCEQGLVLYEGKCLKKCPDGTYTTKDNNCKDCSKSCEECNSPDTCLVCLEGYKKLEGKCVKLCPSGTVMVDEKSCEKCTENCETCLPEDPSVCEVCKNGKPKDKNGKCVEECETKTYNNNNQCTPCVGGCDICNPEQCIKCTPPKFLAADQKTCVSECQDGYMGKDGLCHPCLVNKCGKCAEEPATCEECVSPNVLIDNACVPFCPKKGYYMKDGKCLKCPLDCSICPNEDQCKECAEGYKMNKETNKCEPVCPSGKQMLKNGDCVECLTEGCNACKNNGQKCEQCEEGKFLDPKTNTCLYKCPDGTYTSDTKTCEQCGPQCSVCNPKACVECDKETVLQNGKCVEKCDPSYYAYDAKVCLPCVDTKCVSCDPNAPSKCNTCDEGYVEINGKCDIKCPDGTYKFVISEKKAECRPCLNNCKECPNQDVCKKCEDGTYMIDNNECVPVCPKGYVQKGDKCVQCVDSYCNACDGNNPAYCNECDNKHFIKNNKCVDNCGSGYYASNTKECIPCTDKDCEKCAPQNECQKCKNGQVVVNGQCVEECPSGLVRDNNGICQGCTDTKCHKCSGAKTDVCEECQEGMVKQTDGKCAPVCKSNEYLFENRICLPCVENCKSCKSDTVCTDCKEGWKKDANGNCVGKCPDGSEMVNGVCEPCVPTNCKTCDGTLKDCLNCKPGYKKMDDKCVELCPDGTVKLGQTCYPCPKDCKLCPELYKCEECVSPMVLDRGVCVPKCEEGYTRVDGVCRECENWDVVKKCDQGHEIECKEGYVLMPDKKTCSEVCEDGSYKTETNTCEKCKPNCETCKDGLTCDKCAGKTFTYNNECVETCPDKTIPVNKVCVPCTDTSCKKCSQKNTDTCTECPKGTYLMNGDCVPTCPAGTWLNMKNNKCEECDPTCKVCTSSEKCEKCNSPYIWNPKTEQCDNYCPEGKTMVGDKCLSCVDTKCRKCDNIDLDLCIECKNGYNFDGTCVETCPQGYKMNTKTKKCEECDDYCSVCNPSGCQECTEGYFFDEEKKHCVECNGLNQVRVGNTCVECKVEGCKVCSGELPDECKVCETNRNYLFGHCPKTCPDKFYEKDGECLPCDKSCEKCKNGHSCVECPHPKVLLNGECVETCPLSYTMNPDTKKCEKCEQTECDSCDAKNPKNCNTCQAGYFMYNGVCYPRCPNGTSPKGTTCEPCPEGCSNCKDGKCQGCGEGKVSKDGKCVTECGSGYVLESGVCTKCDDSNCDKCATSKKCEKCLPPTYLNTENDKCETSCETGYYKDDKTQKCEPCDQKCNKCNGEKECVKCDKGLSLINGVCTSTCPDGTSSVDGVCKPCDDKKCNQCPNSTNNCEECKEGELYNGICLPKCPAGTYRVNGVCKDCNPKCNDCGGKEDCTKCKDGFSLVNGKCENVCSDGMTLVNGKCVKCQDENCKSCLSDINQCVDCKPPFYLFRSQCRIVCPDGWFVEGDTCKKCGEGCNQCNSNTDCTKCVGDYYLFNGKCRRECPLGMYGNCITRLCYECSQACAECVDGTPSNCPACAKGYYWGDNECVSTCKAGTWANDKEQACVPCKTAYCSSCDSNNVCKSCIRGYNLVGGNCLQDRAFVSVIGPSGTTFSHQTYRLVRNSEILSFNTDLKGTGVGSDTFSYAFFFRRLSSTRVTQKANIFRTYSPVLAMNIDVSIVSVSGNSEVCLLTIWEGKNVNTVEIGDCSFNALARWNYLVIALQRLDEKGQAVITLNTPTRQVLKQLSYRIPTSINFVNKDSILRFNDDQTPDGQAYTSRVVYQLANFLITDFEINSQEIVNLYRAIPDKCDYTCEDCRGACVSCPGKVKPFEGYCPASFVWVYRGNYLVTNDSTSILRNLLNNSVSSDRWAATFWVYSSNSNASYSVVSLSYTGYSISESYATISVVNSKLIVTVGSESFTLDSTLLVNQNQWYFVAISVRDGSLTVWLRDRFSARINQTFNLKNTLQLLSEDLTLSHSVTGKDGFEGAFVDFRLYVNNNLDDTIVNSVAVNKQCPDNCTSCNKSGVCTACKETYVLTDKGCQENVLGQEPPVLLLPRGCYYHDNQSDLGIKKEIQVSVGYTISLYYRKKAYNSRSFKNSNTILAGVTDSGVTPIIQESNDGQTTRFIFSLGNGGAQKGDMFHVYNGNLSKYIHFAIEISGTSVTYYVTDGSQTYKYVATLQVALVFTKLQVGGKGQSEMNFEITRLQLYSSLLSENGIAQLAFGPPKDCDSGCQDCDYNTGKCLKCISGSTNDSCNNVILGFQHSRAYEVKEIDFKSEQLFNLKISNSLKGDVFSRTYSVVGYYYAHNYDNLLSSTSGASQLFSVYQNRNVEKSSTDFLVALDIENNNKKLTYVLVYNDGENVQRVTLSLEVLDNVWLNFLFSVNCDTKEINYSIQNLNGNNAVTDKVTLNNYPSPLTENAVLSLFGARDLSKQALKYSVVSGQFFMVHLSPTLKFSVEAFKTFQAKFTPPAIPRGVEGCSIADLDDNKSPVCHVCKLGYSKVGEKCVAQNVNKYILFGDNDSRPINPAKNEYNFPSSAASSQNTLAFYLRKNYISRNENSGQVILALGSFVGQVSGVEDGSTLLSFNLGDKNASFRLDTDPEVDYSWYSIVIQYTQTTITIIVTNNSTQKSETKVLTGLNSFNAKKVSFNSLGNQYSIYGSHLVLNKIQNNPLFPLPSSFCDFECEVCVENKCVDSPYGNDSNGESIEKPLRINSLTTGKDSKRKNYFTLSEAIVSKRLHRSRNWSLKFRFEITGTLKDYDNYVLFRLANNKDSNGYRASSVNDNLFTLRILNKSFFGSFSNRHYLSKKGMASFYVNNFTSEPTNNVFYFVLVFNAHSKQVNIEVINSANSKISYTYNFEGSAENLQNDSTLYFGDSNKNKITFDKIKFYYRKALSLEKIRDVSKVSQTIFQGACKSNSRNKCLKCDENSSLVDGVCVAVEKSHIWGVGKTLSVASSGGFGYKPERNIYAIDNERSFSVSFWYRRPNSFNEAHGILSVTVDNGTTKTKLVEVTMKSNILQVLLYNEKGEQINSNHIPNFHSTGDHTAWHHLTLSFDLSTNSIQINDYHAGEKSSRNEINSLGKDTGITLNSSKQLNVLVGYEVVKGAGWNFEFSSFVINHNHYPKSSSDIERCRTRVPKRCGSNCLEDCDDDGLCPEGKEFDKDITVTSVVEKDKNWSKNGKKYPLYRRVSTLLPELRTSQTWTTYVLSFQVDVAGWINSQSANQQHLLNIHNNPSSLSSTLTLDDIIPTTYTQFGAITLSYNGKEIVLNIGSSYSTQVVESYTYPIEQSQFNLIKSLTVQIYVDSSNSYSQLILSFDDLRIIFPLNSKNAPQALSSTSNVYTHPAVHTCSINVTKPRLINNQFERESFLTSPPAATRFCQALVGCNKCTYQSSNYVCDSCLEGYKLESNTCTPADLSS
jgi:hypothetical protein